MSLQLGVGFSEEVAQRIPRPLKKMPSSQFSRTFLSESHTRKNGVVPEWRLREGPTENVDDRKNDTTQDEEIGTAYITSNLG